MAKFSFESPNLKSVQEKFAGFSNGAAIKEATEKAANDALGDLADQMANYPPPPSGSRYVRTYKLRGGWTGASVDFKQNYGFAFEASVSNPVKYGGYVQGQGTQAEIHRGRWQTDQAVLNNNADNIEQYFEDAVKDAVDGHFGQGSSSSKNGK